MDAPPQKGPDKETIEQDVKDDDVHVVVTDDDEVTNDVSQNGGGSDEDSDETENQLESTEGGEDSKSKESPEKEKENTQKPAGQESAFIQRDDIATSEQPDSQDNADTSTQEGPQDPADPGRHEEPEILSNSTRQEDQNRLAEFGDAMEQNPEKLTEKTSPEGDKELSEGVIRFTDKQGLIESDVDVIDEDQKVDKDEEKEVDKELEKVLKTVKDEPVRRVSINTNGNIVKLMNKTDIEGSLNNGQTVDGSRPVNNSERYVKNGGFKPRYSNGDVVLEVPTTVPDGRRSGRSSPVIIHEIHDVSRVFFTVISNY